MDFLSDGGQNPLRWDVWCNGRFTRTVPYCLISRVQEINLRPYLLLTVFLFPSPGLADDWLTAEEARNAAMELHQQIIRAEKSGLKIRNGIVTETDQGRLWQAGADLLRGLFEYHQKLNANNAPSIVPEQRPLRPNHLKKHTDCSFAAVRLARIANDLGNQTETPDSISNRYLLFKETEKRCSTSLK
ncbi:hypothetical protein ABVF61_19990 [Roseibium sp. HPY-6]|uniref:hypothetical protein n=1 Tax=Roseibium sp. HPY-6 TaxID=3229852 RepID=UPI00338D7E78